VKTALATIRIDAETHAMLKAYSDATGVPISKVAVRAIREWMETAGRRQAQALASKEPK
jgi:hypothetical protein